TAALARGRRSPGRGALLGRGLCLRPARCPPGRRAHRVGRPLQPEPVAPERLLGRRCDPRQELSAGTCPQPLVSWPPLHRPSPGDAAMPCRIGLLTVLALLLLPPTLPAADADLILHNGKVVTVDKKFSVHQAIAVQDGKVLRVGTNADVL